MLQSIQHYGGLLNGQAPNLPPGVLNIKPISDIDAASSRATVTIKLLGHFILTHIKMWYYKGGFSYITRAVSVYNGKEDR